MTVPVTLDVDTDTKKYEVSVGVPTTTSLLLKKAGANEPSGDPEHKKVGNISLDDVIEVAISKKPSLTAKELKGAVKSILGTAKSIGLTVENRDPKALVGEVSEGKYDDKLKQMEEKWSS